jgi:hypothetical protein
MGLMVQDITVAPSESVYAARCLVSANKHNLENVAATITRIFAQPS